MDQETQECCNYNAKNQFIQKFTKEVIKAGKRFDKTACERQKFLYHDVYITWLDKCPRTYTMRDIRSMQLWAWAIRTARSENSFARRGVCISTARSSSV